MSRHVLLTVSGTIPPDHVAQAEAGRAPHRDYAELARVCNADLLDYPMARAMGGWFGTLLERFGGSNLLLSWVCFARRHQYRVIMTDGEQVGLPLAVLLKLLSFGARPQHLMITHIISVPKKMVFLDWLRVHSHIDRFLVYATWQKRFIEERWHVPAERVSFTPFMVDTHFFSADRVTANPDASRTICSVGLERRDYPTLLAAVDGVDVHAVIAAASPWAKQPDTTAGQTIPPNVTVQRFNQYDLRQLYADSRFLVMPLYNVDFQAGVTAILEAMAMGRAVICSRTPGQTDVVVEGETGLYVAPGDAAALRTAIQSLLDNPAAAQRMGQAGRALVEREMSLEQYAERLNRHVQAALAVPG